LDELEEVRGQVRGGRSEMLEVVEGVRVEKGRRGGDDWNVMVEVRKRVISECNGYYEEI
jgi:hypothetical protein